MKKNSICVYTCLTGNYDYVNEIKKKEKGIDYYLFTNNKEIKSDTWNVVYLDSKLDNQHLARKTKILGHEAINGKYDIYVWMDASIIFEKSITEFIEKYYKENDLFVTIKHHSRNTIEEEAYECIRRSKDTKENILSILKFLKKENYPQDFGLNETTVFIRKDISYIKDTMELWYKTLETYTIRDQLSCMYAVWKTNLKIKLITLNIWNNTWFSYVPHNNYSKEIKKYRLYFYSGEEYDVKNDFQGEFIKNNDKYIIKHKVTTDTSKTVVELPRKPFIIVKSILINGQKEKVHFFNSFEIKSGNFIFNENGAFEFYKKLKKDESLKIEIEIVESTDFEKIEAYTTIYNKNELIKLKEEEISNLKSNVAKLTNEINLTNNRKIVKVANKIGQIRRK